MIWFSLVLFCFYLWVEWMDEGRPVREWTKKDWAWSSLSALGRVVIFPFILFGFLGLAAYFLACELKDKIEG